MGAADVASAAVDPECRVIGAGALRHAGGPVFALCANAGIDLLTVTIFIFIDNYSTS